MNKNYFFKDAKLFFDKIQNKSVFLIFAFCQKQQYFSIPDFFKFYPVPQKQPQLWSKSTHRNVSPHFRILRPRAIKQNMVQGAENSLRTSNMALKLIGHVYLSRLQILQRFEIYIIMVFDLDIYLGYHIRDLRHIQQTELETWISFHSLMSLMLSAPTV